MPLDQATRVVLIRHGETDWNLAGRIQGHTDIPLNRHGQRQAERVAAALASEAIDAVYSSDLHRARATAEAVAGHHALTVSTAVDLRERSFGRFEGMTWDEISAAHPEDAERWRRREPDFAVGGGESLNQFSARCVAALLRLAVNHPGGQLVVVAHGGVLDCLYRAATGADLAAARSWALGNATLNRVLVSHGRISLVGWNDDRHLEGLSADDETA